VWLNSNVVEDVKRLGYNIVVGPPTGDYSFRRAQVRGFRVLWVLDDCTTCTLGTVVASHKSSLPSPPPDVAAKMKALAPVGPLRAGDLVVAAATTLLAWTADADATASTPRILELVFCLDGKIGQEGPVASAKSTTLLENLTNDHWTFADDRYLINPEWHLQGPSHFVQPPPPEMPPWFYQISPEQQATVGGHAAMAAVHSDGVHARLKEPARVAQASTREEAERWFFDTHGCESIGSYR
jgi:hypothetical protein